MTCAWADEPCHRTDVRSRHLCPMHYMRAVRAGRLDEFSVIHPDALPIAEARRRGYLVCRCVDPIGPADGACGRCGKLNPSPERIAYLRARAAAA